MKLTPRVWARAPATVIALFSRPVIKIAIIIGSPYHPLHGGAQIKVTPAGQHQGPGVRGHCDC